MRKHALLTLRRRRKSPPQPYKFGDLIERPDCNKSKTFAKRGLKVFSSLPPDPLLYLGMVGISSDAWVGMDTYLARPSIDLMTWLALHDRISTDEEFHDGVLEKVNNICKVREGR